MKLKKLVIVLLLLGFVCSVPGYRQIVETAGRLTHSLTMVVDAGHGGMDGGAQAADGTTEQQINLKIAEAIEKEAEKYDIKTVLTRKSESGLYEEGKQDGKWTKMGDMRERKRIIEETRPDVTVSIHLNSYTADTSVCGPQVFYSEEGRKELVAGNRGLAEQVRQSLRETLGERADRAVMSKSDIYLFRNIDEHMILIECGFLSNPAEAADLKREEYQRKIASSVVNAVCEYFNIPCKKTEKREVVDSRTK